jgi:hypothetical protein
MLSEGSLDKVIGNRVFEVFVGASGDPNQFLYIDCWQCAVLIQPTWLKPHLEEACSVMIIITLGWQQLPSVGKNVKSQRNPY